MAVLSMSGGPSTQGQFPSVSAGSATPPLNIDGPRQPALSIEAVIQSDRGTLPPMGL